MSELADDEIPVVVSYQVLKVARGPMWRWLREPVGPAKKPAERGLALEEAKGGHAEFVYPLLTDEALEEGFPTADRSAWRLCNQAGFMSAIVKNCERVEGKHPRPPCVMT